jgi:tetratricopeptide (TPR) repeat protein
VTLIGSYLDAQNMAGARAVVDTLLAEAKAAGDVPAAWKARVYEQWVRAWSDPTIDLAAADALVEQALPVFEAAGDDHGMAIALHVRGDCHLASAQWAESMVAYQRAIPYAAATDPALEQSLRGSVVGAAAWGVTPVPELLEIIPREVAQMPSPETVGDTLGMLAIARAMAGDADQARADIQGALRRRTEVIGPERAAIFAEGLVEYILGDLVAAESALRRTTEHLEQGGETGARSTLLALLALVLFELGRRDDDIQPVIDRCRTLASDADAVTQTFWRDVQALLEARNGRLAEARALISGAAEIAGRTDFLYMKGIVERDRARIEEIAGQPDAARAAYQAALDFFERKQDVVDAGQMREALARLN